MPASTQIEKWIGATGSITRINITGVNQRMTTADENASGSPTTNPVPIPTAGSVNRSFWQNTTLIVGTTPAGTINNVKWYTDGANSFGTGVVASGSQTGSYLQASGTVGTSGDLLQNGSILWKTPAFDIFSKTSGAPQSITGSITNPSTGSFCEFLSYQASVISTAVAGATATETLTWQYDET